MRVRPSEPRDEHFEDLTTSTNASKDGFLLHDAAVRLLSRDACVRDMSLQFPQRHSGFRTLAKVVAKPRDGVGTSPARTERLPIHFGWLVAGA
jgi:hypothetical protein